MSQRVGRSKYLVTVPERLDVQLARPSTSLASLTCRCQRDKGRVISTPEATDRVGGGGCNSEGWSMVKATQLLWHWLVEDMSLPLNAPDGKGMFVSDYSQYTSLRLNTLMDMAQQ